MKAHWRSIFFLLILFFWGASQLHSSPQKTPPLNTKNMDYRSCGTIGCHDNLENKKFVHGPVKADGCHLCHTPTPGQHKFTLYSEENKLCLQCHEEFQSIKNLKRGKKLTIVTEQKEFQSHPLDFLPVPSKKKNQPLCLHCHDPHQSDTQGLVKLEGGDTHISSLCLRCHQKINPKNSHPMQAKSCLGCHSFHKSKPGTALLKFPKTKLEGCLDCHQNIQTVLKGKHKDVTWSVAQPKQAQKSKACLVCHSVHASATAGSLLVKGSINELCMSCHKNNDVKDIVQIKHMFKHRLFLFSSVPGQKPGEEVKPRFFTKQAQKAPSFDDSFELSCATCHDPHSAPVPSKGKALGAFLLNPGQQVKFCASCHGKEAQTLFRNFHNYGN
ncbi:MAG: hypothetical protein HYS98_04060 [Deltaproteobacteria bacterium]|nr:hypothetical protein [Deltaproteobacteria bacterium]